MLASEYQDYMFGLLKKVIDEIGPRPPCSEAEKKLGRLLVEEWKPFCDRAELEPFTCSPTAADGSISLLALLYLLAVILYWFLPPLALAFAAACCATLVLEILTWREFVDFLFPRKQGENVVGTIRPKGEPAQRVIVSAHMDSVYEWNLFLYLKIAAFLLIVVVSFASFVAFGACLAKTLAYFNVFSNDAALTGVGIAMIAVSPLAALFFFWTSRKAVPGAWDNMSGVSVVAGLGKYLGEAKKSGDWFPERTEVVLLGMSSEEARSRGAKRYVKRHLKEMQAMKTYCLIIDCVGDENFTRVYKGELCGAKHDPQLVKMAQEVAASHNWPIRVELAAPSMGFDGASFSVSGIAATCLQSGDPSKTFQFYHTRYDTYERVRPESLSAMLQLVIDMIQRIDKR